MTTQQKLLWQKRLRHADSQYKLNQAAREIAQEMQRSIPDQSTILSVMATYETSKHWDRETKPFNNLSTEHNKIDTIGLPA